MPSAGSASPRYSDLVSRAARIGAPLAGPAIIVGGVLVVLRALAFRGQLTTQHPDLLSTFLPSWCLLGKSLAAGHIPSWNPHVMGGIPFAADPLAGWAYAPVMLLFSLLPCGLAMRWFIVLQPILGGLGIYWFLRTEGTSRAAATVGGSTFAFAAAGSALVLSLPFSATLTWTALLLAAAARMMRTRSWPARLAWLAVTALAWGQLAAAHLSDGLVPGSIALFLYLVTKGIAQIRSGDRSTRDLALLAGLVIVALPMVNLAFFLPRLAYLPRTSLGQGYARLQKRLAEIRRVPNAGLPLRGIDPTTPLRFTVPGGVYFGALAFVLAFAGWRDRRLLHLNAGFSLYGLVSFVLALKWTPKHAAHLLATGTLGSFYLHETERFAYGLILATAILAGVGLEAWRKAGPMWERALWLLPGLVVWGLIAPVLGFHRLLGWVPPLTLVVGLVVLAVASWRPVALIVVAAVVAAELLAVAVLPLSMVGRAHPLPKGARRLGPYLTLNRAQFFPASDYFREDALVKTLKAKDEGRYLSIAPSVWSPLGYHVRRTRAFWGLLGAQQSMLFGLEEGQGYNSIQLVRYWEFVRAVDPKPIRYNAAGFIKARPLALDLLQVRYLVQPLEDAPAVPGERQIAQHGRWVLYELPAPPGRASLVSAWSAVPSSDAALSAILEPGFLPSDRVVLEGRPGIEIPSNPSTHGVGGSATYRRTGPQSARVDVDALGPFILLIRNVYDPGWHATVDGRPVRILPADYLVQGIPVSAGRHQIRLSYDDPSLGFGLLGTALSLAALFGTAGLLTLQRRRRRTDGASTDSETDGGSS